MRRIAFIAPAVVMAALILPALARAQASPPRIPLDWFEGPEKHHKHWRVQIGPPMLIYSQRFVIGARAVLPLPRKNEPRAEIYFFTRIADQHGKWFEGSDYSRIDLSTIPEKSGMIEWHAGVFVRPGTYQVAVLVYDAGTQEHYLWRKAVAVKRPHLLPDLDQSLPMVEFADDRSAHAPLGEHLPIENRRPLRVDIVLNLTGDLQMAVAPGRWRTYRHLYVESALMGAVSALSQLQPATGCVRVSAIDIVHLEVARDRAPADPKLDWQKVRQTLLKNRDQTTVDIRTLEGRNKAREFFRDFLGRVISDNSGCGPDLPITDRAVVVVSDSLMFPSGTTDEPVSAPPRSGSRFFHVQIRFNGPAYDQVGHMLHSLHPRHFDVDDPEDLRKALAGIIGDLEKPEQPLGAVQ